MLLAVDMRDYVEGILLAERNAEIMKQHATLMTEQYEKWNMSLIWVI